MTECLSQVVLTEVMFDPAGSEHTDEFVEIFNASAHPVDLKGWTVGDGADADGIVDAGEGTILEPEQYGIILDPDYLERSQTYDCIIPDEARVMTIGGSTFGSGGWSNTVPEIVQICDGSGLVVAAYRTSPGNRPGHSDEKIDWEYVSGDVSDEVWNWGESRRLHGTPGFVNSIARCRWDLKVTALSADPPFPRRDDTFSLCAMIVNTGKRAVTPEGMHFYEDFNTDSISDPGEIIEDRFSPLPAIQSGDSLEVRSSPLRFDPGSHSLGMVVKCSEDERPADNGRILMLEVGYLPGDVVVNEIMYAPLEGHPAWVELFNRWGGFIDLERWRMTDADTTHPGLIRGGVLPAGGFTVVAEDASVAAIFPPWGSGATVPAEFPRLNNGGDSVVLFDPAGNCIDRVHYLPEWGGTGGVSLERRDPDLPSSDGSSWTSSL